MLIQDILVNGASEMGLSFNDSTLLAFETFAVELQKWNRKINLTSIIKSEDFAVKHILDSLSLATHLDRKDILSDIGSGAGFPSIPLKILFPELSVVSVDSVEKKILFQKHLARTLGLKQFEAIHARVENMNLSHSKCFTVIVSRAFSDLDLFVSLAAPLLTEDGSIIAMKGPLAKQELISCEQSLAAAGFYVKLINQYKLPFNKGERSLIILKRDKIK